MSFPSTFREYLESKKLLNASDEVIHNAQLEWKKLYARHYWKHYQKKQLSIVLSQKESTYLQKVAKDNNLKMTQYLVHLIRKDMDQLPSKPNLLIELEIGILKTMDLIAKKMGGSPKQRAQLIDIYRQIEELIIIIGA